MSQEIAYAALLIIKIFQEQKVDQMVTFEIEKELTRWEVSHANMTMALTLLYSLGLVKSKGLNILKLREANDDEILGLAKMIINMN